MTDEIFVLALGIFFSVLFAWSFKTLPGEQWQMIASVPVRKNGAAWEGVNLTYYGFFNANSYLLAVLIAFVLLGSLGMGTAAILSLTVLLLALCIPASRLLAWAIEKKAHTFTVGGASFVGIVAAPFLMQFLNRLAGDGPGFNIPVIPAMAALAIAYAMGEGTGRIACISFGCCYGKPLRDCSPFWRKVFAKRNFVFRGETKKIAYEGNLAGAEVVPVQGITVVLYTAVCLLGIYMFLNGWYVFTLVSIIFVTQGWRFFSETLRADYRGGGRISAYQVFAVLAIAYVAAAAFIFRPAGPLPGADLAAGLALVWDPALILAFQAFWALIFLRTGRSSVTGSNVSFFVHRGRI